jgi:site-specific recombinase XerC
VHPHSFSHSFAINIVRHGVDIRRLQQGLGHGSMRRLLCTCSSMIRVCRTYTQKCGFE